MKVMLIVDKGCLKPADAPSQERLRERGLRVGDIVSAEVRKPRRYWQFKRAHLLGQALVENLEEFDALGPHEVLKRLQLESGAGCEVIHLKMPGVGPVEYRLPKSLAFESMDEAEFMELFSALCRHVAKTYWPTLTAEEVASMADLVEGVA